MGQTTFSGPVRSLAGFNPSGFNNVVDFSGSGVTTALTVAAHGGRIITVNDATGIFTVPAIVATEPTDPTDPTQLCNLGTVFRFFIATASTGVSINLSGSDEFVGVLYQIDTDTSDAVAAYPAEAADNLDADIIVNVQGDEPLVHPEMFNPLVVHLKKNKNLDCVNMMAEITSEEEYLNQNVVKVVCDLNDNAIFFSREPIPSAKTTSASFKKYKQLGVIAFRKDFLLKFTHLSPTPLEVIESNDMLRIIENGFSVRMVKSEFPIVGVDTPADLEKVKILMKTDTLFPQYFSS